MNRQKLTMICVTLAGLIFIPSVFFNKPLFALVGAFFDWLPLPTGWMKAEKEINRTFLKLHVIATLIAYVIFIAWLIKGLAIVGFAFLEVWWLAVIFGVFMNY
ncbi:MAG: hypothetical protein H0Z18_10025 [Thermococcus sp.]|uniref:hypothetical protein n=1 Tax=Thermococcus sp. TaxID=35749 RepID=UPI001D850434|nr:hypothetical protein [Thermococcus sp.]MBO8175583.1 hypothetical protein [Thermococcus sp.]